MATHGSTVRGRPRPVSAGGLGVEATVKIAKADLVPSDANLLSPYGSFAQPEDACRQRLAAIMAQ
jgi:hypothetical protein